ncbi:Phosphoribosylglycinamide formyltransferase [Ascosphaera apis ARSEF 7405]|uniref:Phosphoribosylglycinamide formyltransferase n=1 Tax=Ascosphaera apis ARSEF 7405 TaxID=392613 RepID=A0A167XAR8_9EURO|nr:Phosphoribosylglycinamide formyltransferase [Ascosphaera apis ARSEF 7405]
MSSSSTAPTRITVLISGNGSNLQALIDSISQNTLDAQIIRVISNRKTAYGLTRASQAGIPTLYHNLLAYKKKHPATEEGIQAARLEYDTELARLILADEPELVVCLGFMHIVSKGFLDPIQERGVRVINLHPALPGQFNGVHAIERAHAAWKAGQITKTGVMIHDVIAEVDMGEPLLVRDIPFVAGEDDDVEKFEEKVHSTEWKIVPEGVALAVKQVQENKRN